MKDRLKECRQKCGLTQSDVAYALGVAAPSVSQWESGVHRPALENLIQMADLYGASLDYLIGRDNNAPVPHPRQYAKAEEKLITAYRSLSARGKNTCTSSFPLPCSCMPNHPHLFLIRK